MQPIVELAKKENVLHPQKAHVVRNVKMFNQRVSNISSLSFGWNVMNLNVMILREVLAQKLPLIYLDIKPGVYKVDSKNEITIAGKKYDLEYVQEDCGVQKVKTLVKMAVSAMASLFIYFKTKTRLLAGIMLVLLLGKKMWDHYKHREPIDHTSEKYKNYAQAVLAMKYCKNAEE